jgi:ABC-2 type transport system ATP-binding protein
VLLTTQYLDEADQLADRIAVIDHGKVIAEGTSSELKASVGAGALHVRVAEPEQAGKAASLLTERIGGDVTRESDGVTISARTDEPKRVPALLTELGEAGVDVTEFSLGQPSLDEVFLALTGHPAEDETETVDQRQTEEVR